MESPPRSSSPDEEEEFRRRRQQQQQQAAAAYHAQQQAAYEAQQQQQQQQQQKILESKLQKHVQTYPINLKFPAKVFAHTGRNEPVPNDGKTKKNNEEGGATKKQLRTDTEFVNFRLLEAGITFEETRALEDVTNKIGDFIRDMEGTGCYHSVQVVLGRKDEHDDDVEGGRRMSDEDGSGQQQQPQPPSTHVDVILNERNWYKLYIGGGIKHDGALSSMSSSTTSSTSSVPKLQFESSASLLNLTGSCDKSTLSYTLDQTNTGTLSVTHDRPLFTLFPKFSDMYDFILTNDLWNGSQMNIQFRGLVDTLDFESTRSVKEYQRVLGMKIRNGTGGGGGMAEMSTKPYQSIDWSLTFRDLIPRRHRTIPYLSDASPQIITSSGPNMKHSLTYEYRMNGTQCNDTYNPTSGYDCQFNFELACPPGDVGFMKGYGGLAIHLPIVSLPPPPSVMEGGSNGAPVTTRVGRKSGYNFVSSILGGLSLHGCINGGLLHPLSYGGLCNNNNNTSNGKGAGNYASGTTTTTCLSDRFYVGGPLQLRGFVPGGIGPRAETGGESTPGGDALGGNLYYTATLAASIPFPGITFLRNNNVRLMGFANVGTLVDTTNGSGIGIGGMMPPWMSIVRSTRAAIGGGISVGTAMGRLEATYAIPVRYGRMDARRSVQAGLGFSFG